MPAAKLKQKGLLFVTIRNHYLPKFQHWQPSVPCSNRLPQPGPLHVPPPEHAMHHSTQLDKSKERVTTDTVKMFVSHMAAAHTSCVSVLK